MLKTIKKWFFGTLTATNGYPKDNIDVYKGIPKKIETLPFMALLQISYSSRDQVYRRLMNEHNKLVGLVNLLVKDHNSLAACIPYKKFGITSRIHYIDAKIKTLEKEMEELQKLNGNVVDMVSSSVCSSIGKEKDYLRELTAEMQDAARRNRDIVDKHNAVYSRLTMLEADMEEIKAK